GRVFDRADERPDAHVAVVSERIWRAHLAASPDAAGRRLSLNGLPFEVVAVLPASFTDPLEPGVDIWMPLNLQPGGPNSFDNYYLSMIGRLQPRVTLAQAQAELDTLAASMQPPNAPERDRWSARVASLQADTVGSAGPMLWVLLGAVGVLLLIACVNV